ncbi:MAG TPA: FtsQ-type POTRA domain-containing protein [Terracidiphilus sp.]|nr:FtsQ-type POTRA domain-containing protein [Terracidiphilus sp.]
MANHSGNQTRPLVFEDEAPAVARIRRVQQAMPPAGRLRRGGPGMPLEMDDLEDEDDPLSERRGPGLRGFGDKARGRWWRPASTTGRVFLAFGAFMVLSALITTYLMLRGYLEHDARFRIAGTSNIQAAGLSQVSRAQLLPVFGEDIGRNVFFVPLSVRRRELEQISWIQSATVMRLLPDQIRVSVVERQPVAFVRSGRQIELVDAHGVLLGMSPAAMAAHHYSFPVLTGVDPGDSLEARATRIAVYMRLMADLDSSGHHYSQNISEIDLTDPEDARVLMPEPGRDILAHFGEDDFLERYERYRDHIAEWRQQYPRLAAVDLRYDRQVVLQMASGAQAATASGAAAAGDGKPSADGPVEAKQPAAKSVRSKKTAQRDKEDRQRQRRAAARRLALHGAASVIGPILGAEWGL